MELINNVLYGEPKGGTIKQWSVYVDRDAFIVEYGRVGGKMQRKETKCTSKNMGKSNETTPTQQAVIEAESKYKKKLDKFYRPTIEEVYKLETEGVMLAQDYTKKPHFLNQDEFYASYKLDGLRVKSIYKDGLLKWESRGGKTYPVPKHLIESLKRLHITSGFEQLDGEAYVHGRKLEEIQSAVKKCNELTPQITYQIFDIPLKDVVWVDRLKFLNVLDVSSLSHIEVIQQIKCNGIDILEPLISKAIESGYEGLMLRNPNGLYEFKNKRSNDLLKYKKFFDSECFVEGIKEDKNGEGVLSCKWNDIIFELKMKGKHEYRLFKVQQELIGRWINFKYQDLTKAGIPTFAVGQYVRECDSDGNTIE